MTARPQPLARRQNVDPGSLHQSMFGGVVDVAVERDRIGDAQLRRPLDESVLPPAAADDVEVQLRHPGRSSATASRASSICFVRNQAGQHHGARGHRAGGVQRVRRNGVEAVAHDGDRPASTPRSVRSRADGSDTVTYWLRRCSRGRAGIRRTSPAGRRTARDRPLLAVTVVHQHRHPPAEHQPGQERHTVLGVDDYVGADAAQWTQSEPGGDHGQAAKM